MDCMDRRQSSLALMSYARDIQLIAERKDRGELLDIASDLMQISSDMWPEDPIHNSTTTETTKPQYKTVKEARRALFQRDLDEGTVDEMFAAVDAAVPVLLDEYRVGDDVDQDEIREMLKIGIAETTADFLDDSSWDKDDVRRIIAELESDPISSLTVVSGRLAGRDADMQLLSGAMLSSK